MIVILLFALLFYTVKADKIIDTSPEQGAADLCPCDIVLCVEARSSVGIMNITLYSNLSGVWHYMYLGVDNVTLANVPNGTYCVQVPYFSEYGRTYYWRVRVEDTVSINESAIFQFITTTDLDCCEGVGGASYSWLIGIVIVFMGIPLGVIIRMNKRRGR